MAGANNKALKKAGMTAREVETFRAAGGKSLRATVTAAKNSPTVQGANADFRAKAAAGLKNVAERKAALQAARQQRVGKSLGAAMQIARGMRQKQAAEAQAKAAAAAPTAKANPRTVRSLDAASRHLRAGRIAEADRMRRAKTIRDEIHNGARNLPELQGSPKQVAWANELRAKAVKAIMDAHDSTPLMRINGTAWAAMDVASRVRNAKTWIDFRGSVERGDVLGISGMHTREGIKINWERWKKNAPGKR